MKNLNLKMLRQLIVEELQIGSQHALALQTGGGHVHNDLQNDYRGSHPSQLILGLLEAEKGFLLSGNASGEAGSLNMAASHYADHFEEDSDLAIKIYGSSKLASQVLHIAKNIGDVMVKRKDVLERLVKILDKASSNINLVGPYHVHPSSYIAEARDTLPIYSKIIDFLKTRVYSQNNLQINKPTLTRLEISVDGQEVIAAVPNYKITIKSLPPYADYVAATGDDGSATGGKPIIWEHTYNTKLANVGFRVTPDIGTGAGGAFDDSNFIFHKDDWNIDLRKLADGTLSKQELSAGLPGAQAALSSLLSTVEDLLNHEKVHLISYLRTGVESVRRVGGSGDARFVMGTPKYYSTKEEIWAYFLEGAKRFERILDIPVVKDGHFLLPKKKDMDYVYYLAIRDKKKFIRAFINVIIIERHGRQHWDGMDAEARKRFIKNVSELYDKNVGSQKIAVRQMVKYLAGSKLKPPARELMRDYSKEL